MELADNKQEQRSRRFNPGENIENLFDQVGDYVETRIDLFKLKSTYKISDIASTAVTQFLFIVIAMMFFIVLNFGLGYWLGDVLGKVYYGFFALAAFYLVVGLIYWFTKDSMVKKPMADSLIKKIL